MKAPQRIKYERDRRRNDRADAQDERLEILDDRVETIAQATGINNRTPEKGIAARIDAIEETQEEILARLDKLESD